MRALRTTTASFWGTARWPADLVGGLVVVFLVLVSAAPLLLGGTVVGQDTAAFFAPMYGFLGERLRSGALPVWNPYQFSGAPFLADPESGWLYWPAMLLFTLLPVAAAVRAFLLLHLLLAALSVYLFGRLTGFTVAGAVTAAGVYALSGVVYGRSVCCPAYIQLAAWLPVALLAVELAIRAGDWPRRFGWCWLSSFAISQIFASWLGQGSYYALLVIGAYVLYRVGSRESGVGSNGDVLGQSSRVKRQLFLLPTPDSRLPTFLSGILTVAFGIWLSAAVILPRLEFRAQSTLADGYGGALEWAAERGGWGWGDLDNRLLSPGLTYTGGAVAVLALVALFLARGRLRVPFFAAMAVGILLLSTAWQNPLQWLLMRVLPEFGELHRHWPERAMVVFPLAPAMLAGAVVTLLPEIGRARRGVALLPLLLPLAMLIARLAGAELHWLAIGGAAAAASAFAVAPRLNASSHRSWLSEVIGFVLVAELFVGGLLLLRDGPYGGFHRLDLDTFLAPDGAATFLAAQQGDEAWRFLGYNPVFREIESEHGEVTYYRYHFADDGTRTLLVNNLGTLFALPDVQGYNPLQMQHYVDFMRVLNGAPQEYHGSWVLPTGLDSPLVDLLGVRFVVVPAVAPPDRHEIERLARTWPVVYRDEEVRVLENPDAFPRAWLVHSATVGDTATLAQGIANSSLDLRTEAVVVTASPELTPARDPAAERVSVTNDTPEGMTLQVTATSPALLVTSETDYPAWQAYLDDEPVDTVRTNGAFRGVAIPPGTHTVEFRYESSALNIGLALSFTGYVAMIFSVAVIVRHVRQARRTVGADGVRPP